MAPEHREVLARLRRRVGRLGDEGDPVRCSMATSRSAATASSSTSTKLRLAASSCSSH